MPYKDKEKQAEAMRRYRLRKNPRKYQLNQVRIIFIRAYVHARHYPERLTWRDCVDEAHGIHDLTKNVYFNPSVDIQLKQLRYMLGAVDHAFWRAMYEDDLQTPKNIPEEDLQKLNEEYNVLHDLLVKCEKDLLHNNEILWGVDYPLPLDVHEEE